MVEGRKQISAISEESNKKTFKNKQELVDFIKKQTNITLENDVEGILNKKRNVLYTYVSRDDAYKVFPLLHKYGIRSEGHLKGYYWIWIK